LPAAAPGAGRRLRALVVRDASGIQVLGLAARRFRSTTWGRWSRGSTSCCD